MIHAIDYRAISLEEVNNLHSHGRAFIRLIII